jgi:hypothetical protein
MLLTRVASRRPLVRRSITPFFFQYLKYLPNGYQISVCKNDHRGGTYQREEKWPILGKEYHVGYYSFSVGLLLTT